MKKTPNASLSYILTMFLSFFSAFFSMAQSFEWAEKLGGLNNDMGVALAIDKDSNVIIAGIDDFGGQENILLSKYDPNGLLVWTHLIGGNHDEIVNSVDVDTAGNIYIAGYFSMTTDFDPGSGVFNLVTGSPYEDVSNAYFAKYDNSGNFIWARAIICNSYTNILKLKLDPAGNIFISGTCSPAADFDPGSGTYNLSSGRAFYAKYDTTGSLVWVKGIDASTIRSLDIDHSGNLYLTGAFGGFADFDPGPGSIILTSAYNGEGEDIFIAKYSPSGSYIWAKSFRSAPLLGSYLNAGNDILLDIEGNILITGFYNMKVDFDPGPDTLYIGNWTNGQNVGAGFIGKYSNNGNLIWVYGLRLTADDRSAGKGITSDASGNIYWSGWYKGISDFDPGLDSFLLSQTGLYDRGFYSKLSPSGELVFAQEIRSLTQASSCNAVILDDGRNIILTGNFACNVDFDNGSGNCSITPQGHDVFTMKLSQCVMSTYDTADFCDGQFYFFPDGDSSNQSCDHLSSYITSNGCDSLIFTNLQLVTFEQNLVLLGDTLMTLDSGALYQWLDCENGYFPLTGENNHFFIPNDSGYYAVEVSKSSCVDTTLCSGFSSIFKDNSQLIKVYCYPNPVVNELTIHAPGIAGELNVSIYDFTGKVLTTQTVVQSDVCRVDFSKAPAGVYCVKLMASNLTPIVYTVIK